jgi:3-hydroxyisobutyrate dehydrogenase
MRIGWIGTGVMGSSMAGHLQQAGHALAVFNRTRAKAEGLVRGGATWCSSPRAVAEVSEVVFSIVGFPQDVEETYLGSAGVLTAAAVPRLIVDMTTSQPALARRLAEAAAARGIRSLDAPVSGGDVGARNATLAIMVGGERAAFDEALPLLQALGKNIAYMGPAGAGQHTKMCNQILIAGTMIGVCEALLYAARSGLDRQAVIAIVGSGAAGSWSINNLGPRIVADNYAPGFFVEHFIKDMGIALDEARAMGLALPGLALVHQLYLAVRAQGHGRDGTQALMKALRTLNGEPV